MAASGLIDRLNRDGRAILKACCLYLGLGYNGVTGPAAFIDIGTDGTDVTLNLVDRLRIRFTGGCCAGINVACPLRNL